MHFLLYACNIAFFIFINLPPQPSGIQHSQSFRFSFPEKKNWGHFNCSCSTRGSTTISDSHRQPHFQIIAGLVFYAHSFCLIYFPWLIHSTITFSVNSASQLHWVIALSAHSKSCMPTLMSLPLLLTLASENGYSEWFYQSLNFKPCLVSWTFLVELCRRLVINS